MKLCPQGHENRDGATRCETCLRRFSTARAVLELHGVPETPVPVWPGRVTAVTISLVQRGGAGGACTVALGGEATAWAELESRVVPVEPGSPTPVHLRVLPPVDAAAGLWSLDLRAEGSPGVTAADAGILLQVATEPRDRAAEQDQAQEQDQGQDQEQGQEQPGPADNAWLEVGGVRHPLAAGTTVVGREHRDDVDLVFTDETMSRRHFELRLESDGPGAGVTLRDLDSTNGTFVNGRRTSEARLRDHDQVTAGRSSFTFRAGAT